MTAIVTVKQTKTIGPKKSLKRTTEDFTHLTSDRPRLMGEKLVTRIQRLSL